MVNNQCYVCNSNVTYETSGDVREKYYNVIGNKVIYLRYIQHTILHYCIDVNRSIETKTY